jgi:ribonuclease G
VEAYIKKGVFSLYGKWRREFGRSFKIIADESMAYLQYKVIDADGKELDLKEESDAGTRQTKEKKRAKKRDNEEAE